jgi:FG-GAP repeat
VAVGAPDASPSGRAKAGIVHIAFGPYGPDRDLATASGLRSVGGAAGDGLGTAVAPTGDLDGDGSADVLVGAPHGDGGAGAAYREPPTSFIRLISAQRRTSSTPSSSPATRTWRGSASRRTRPTTSQTGAISTGPGG